MWLIFHIDLFLRPPYSFQIMSIKAFHPWFTPLLFSRGDGDDASGMLYITNILSRYRNIGVARNFRLGANLFSAKFEIKKCLFTRNVVW